MKRSKEGIKMNSLFKSFGCKASWYTLFIASLFSCLQPNESSQISNDPPFSSASLVEIGTLQSRNSKEIESSKLWVGCEVLDRDYADYHAYKDYLFELGAKKARLQSGWAKTETEKGVYNFDWLDAIVNDLIDKEITPWLQISYGNSLYEGAGGISLGEGLPTTEVGLMAWENYTRALVSHFQDRVFEWEIWNEADHRYNNTSSDAYAELFYRTAKIIRELQPNSKILALSLAGVGDTTFTYGFFEYLKKRNAVGLVDVVTFHGYLPNPDKSFESITELTAVVHSFNPEIEMWQGETGCPSTLVTSGALRQYPWSEKIQAKWVLRRALAHLGRGYPYLQFTISDFIYDRKLFNGLNSKGLLAINDDKSVKYTKPSYHAYQNLTSILDDSFMLDTAFQYASSASYHMSSFHWDGVGGDLIAIWLNGSKPTQVDWYIPIEFEFSGVEFEEPVLVDLQTGVVYQIPRESYSVKEGVFQIQELPVYDSPILVMEKTSLNLRN